MTGTSGRILRGEDVIFDGQYLLGVGLAEIAGAVPQQKNATSAPTRVRIVQNHSQYAVLEVTCTCGKTMHLRCEYASTQAPNVAQTPDGAPVVSG
ncbi:MAG: hypothetical protein P8Z79_01085 [Sedimentisphaerales bacterium]|jgi:hypothetical protein